MASLVEIEIKKLRKELHQHNYRYYVLDAPAISDYDFDVKLRKLQDLECKYPIFFDDNSPTRRVGGQVTKRFKSVIHQHRMYSLGNSYSREDLLEWKKRAERLIGHYDLSYTCEPKYDGASISLIYEGGRLIRAVSRGDGFQGDDVTNNIRTIKAVPLRLLDNSHANVEIRGEVLLPITSFQEINKRRVSLGEEPYMNPRNTASGSLKLQDSREVASRNLDFFAYALLGRKGVSTQIQGLDRMREYGFKVPEGISLENSIEGVFNQINRLERNRNSLDYEIDGVVIKINDLTIQSELGYTSKSPRWAMAYKFKAERVSTTFLSLDYQVGRTGAITPVANLEPILLGGTIVKRASLYNADQIDKLDLHERDTVYVEKGGEIIPKIVSIDIESRLEKSQRVVYITSCPECGSTLERKAGEAHHYCDNSYGCFPQIRGRIEHFISRKAMDIEGLGGETVALLVENNFIENYADLYDLKKEQIIVLDRIAEKSANNIIKGILNSKKQPYHKVLYALGIRYVGETVARKISMTFTSLDALKQASISDLESVDDIGHRIAESVVEFFCNPYNKAIIERLEKQSLNFQLEKTDVEKLSERLQGMSFVISGVFEMSRDDLKQLIESHGGVVASSISKKTSYVVAGKNMGYSKKEKAEKLSIGIISEQEVLSMLG